MAVELPPSLSSLRWFRIACKVTNLQVSPATHAHPVTVFQAIIKDLSRTVFPESKGEDGPPLIFHIKELRYTQRVRRGEVLSIEFLLLGSDRDRAERFAKSLAAYLADPITGRNYGLIEIHDVEERSLQTLCSEILPLKSESEMCLDFLVPVPFRPSKKRNRTIMSARSFVDLLMKRVVRIFGVTPPEQNRDPLFTVNSLFWKYTEIKRQSQSEPGAVQYINGCIGKIYLKGEFHNILPLIILGSEIHLGAKISYSQGYYKILDPPPGYFPSFFPDKKMLRAAFQDVHERYDMPEHGESDGHIIDQQSFLDQLFQDIQKGSWIPSPNVAFAIKKKDGSERIVEQLHLRDMIVHHYLLKILQDPLDRLFDEGSIGYRKGMSREKAMEMVRNAIREGYRFVLESDITDFFGSVVHSRLTAQLELYIPVADTLVRDLIQKAISEGYVLNGKYFERMCGLAQGSPLSPLLANLYLNSFDEEAQKWNVRMIRYADDFIILTRTREEAESVLAKAGTALSDIGLKLSPDKTSIKPIAEGFQFLGISFSQNETQVDAQQEPQRLLKPLYVTEPYVFLNLNGDAIDIRRHQQLIETIPLRRLSEILVMEKASFSTSLLRKCTESNIPFTITLGSGYYITTIKPDSKKYHDLGFQQGRRYYALTDTEILSIAKDFASRKIEHYGSLFRQRYVRGQNRVIRELEEAVEKVRQAGNINEVRGIEGSTARKIYQNLNSFIDSEAFKIKKRERLKPDRINSLMNFGHYMTFSRINATVRSMGLNPYLGFLHAAEDNYESLVVDIQELFRAQIDRFLIRLVNLKVIQETDFIESDRGMHLTHEAAKKFLEQFEYEIERKPSGDAYPLSQSIHAQAEVFRQWALQGASLVFYKWSV
jgi:CRISPR-associated protein Cas1